MKSRLFLAITLAWVGIAPAICAFGQSDQDVPLGDVARAYRRKETQTPAASPPVIDNDNLHEVMQQADKQRQSGMAIVSFDNLGKTFEVAAPDVTCNLAFNAGSASLLSDAYVARPLPASELANLDGPATIDGDALQLNVYNGTSWKITEITVGLTIVRPDQQRAAAMGNGRIVPAASVSSATPEKLSDVTVLYHLKGTAAPFTSTVFREDLGAPIGSDREWHWAIVEAKGTPPQPAPPQAGAQ